MLKYFNVFFVNHFLMKNYQFISKISDWKYYSDIFFYNFRNLSISSKIAANRVNIKVHKICKNFDTGFKYKRNSFMPVLKQKKKVLCITNNPVLYKRKKSKFALELIKDAHTDVYQGKNN